MTAPGTLIVVALGGNALLERGEAPESDIQQAHVRRAAQALAPLARRHRLVITHGNGPQVGMLALESEHDPALRRPYPFDALGAQTQGMIGYWLVDALHNAAGLAAACLISRTLVRTDDPAFEHPTKFVGPVYDQATAQRLAAERGWRVRADGAGWRRVVASPEPVSLLELDQIRQLINHGTTPVCAGGGGIPVRADDTGALHGVEAVVDKDLTSALLATELGAHALLLLTDVDAVYRDYGTPRQARIARASARDLSARDFPAGSMRPKIEAARRFATATSSPAAIGRLDDAHHLLDGHTGTLVTP
ncbi:carbamate kinase [Pseudonocardia acaciae]|uniref:carbamate kinase n=1 Tax=Pseudonocardia acaciae TaxID=551276 RepID=UPI00048FA7BA|nr:carbamate kinase [Pseudonocardia acaciae]